MMYTNFQKVNGLKSVEVTRMQVTEGRVNPAYKLQVAFFLLYVVFLFLLCSLFTLLALFSLSPWP